VQVVTPMIRELLCLDQLVRKVWPIGFLLLGFTFFCGAAFAAIQSPPPPPLGLTTQQVSVWNDWTQEPGFKNIWIIQFDRSALLSSSITLDVEGRSYRLDGKSSRLKPFLLVDENGRRIVGGVSWSGQSAQGSGTITETDDGEFGGSFTLDKIKVYNIIGVDGLTFLVELDQTPPKIAESEPPAPSVAQTKGDAACSAVNQTMRPPGSAVLFGPGSERQFSDWQSRQICIGRLMRPQGEWRARRINRLAVDSDVIVVDIDGKRYKFAGTNRCGDAPPMDFWNGQTSSGDRLQIHRTPNNIFASFVIGARSYTFSAQDAEYGLLWESTRTPVVATPAAIPTIRATPPPRPVDVTAQRAMEKCQQPISHRFAQEKARSESRNVPTKAEMCADLERGSQRMHLWLRLPQPKYMRQQLKKWLGPIRERQREIHC